MKTIIQLILLASSLNAQFNENIQLFYEEDTFTYIADV